MQLHLGRNILKEIVHTVRAMAEKQKTKTKA
jgi:hypothetical protein